MKDKVNTPEKADVLHVWQYEHEVLEDEEDVTIKVAEGTQVVGSDGKLHAEGESLKVPGATGRQHIAAGRAQASRKA